MATALPILDIQEPGADLARKTVFIKLHLGLLGNSRKVSSSQVEVDADKELIRVAKTLLDSPELQAIRTLDGDVRRYLYDTCLPFDVGIHLLPLGLLETVDEKLGEFSDKRGCWWRCFLLPTRAFAKRPQADCAPSITRPTIRRWRKSVPALPSVGNTSVMACQSSFGKSPPECSRRSATRLSRPCRKPARKSNR